MDKVLLTKMFKDNLKNSHEAIGACYNHLFSILPKNNLEENIEWLYQSYTEDKDKPANEQYWFYNFHKSMRQGDFFQDCTRTTRVSLLTPEEKAEMIKLAEDINAEWKQVNVEQRKANPNMLASDYFKATYPEKYKRHRELVVGNQNKETDSINGHLDMILWNLIHVDKKDYLRLCLLRTFKQYDLEMEMLDELSKMETPEKNNQ